MNNLHLYANEFNALGLNPTYSLRRVKARYREMILSLHPDKSGINSTGIQFQRVRLAYHRLAAFIHTRLRQDANVPLVDLTLNDDDEAPPDPAPHGLFSLTQ